MTNAKLTQCINECNRFVARAMALQDANTAQDGEKYKAKLPKQQGAVRRASMDLSRALAELRRT